MVQGRIEIEREKKREARTRTMYQERCRMKEYWEKGRSEATKYGKFQIYSAKRRE